MPERIQRRRTPGWRMPAGVVYVGRPSRWGNPWHIGADRPPDLILPMYRRHVELYVSLGKLDLSELRGHDLACWCKLDQPCHADVLLDLANRVSA